MIPHLGPQLLMAQRDSAFSTYEIPHLRHGHSLSQRPYHAGSQPVDRANTTNLGLSCHIRSLHCSLGIAFLRSKWQSVFVHNYL